MLAFKPEVDVNNTDRQPKIIGLILPLSDNPFYNELAQGIEDAIAKADLRVLIGYSREDEVVELDLLNAMVESGFKGIIVTPVGRRNQIFDKFISNKIPVNYLAQSDEQPRECAVSIDQVLGGYIGIEYLHSLGHKNILWVAGPKHHHQSNQRFVGIAQASQEFGVELQSLVAPSLDFISGEHIGLEIMALPKMPDAIFAGNDALALGIINYLTKVGMKIPHDVSVLGFDNTAYAESALIPLTTVSQTPYQLGFTMGDQMISELSAGPEHVHQHIIFKPHIVMRESTQPRSM